MQYVSRTLWHAGPPISGVGTPRPKLARPVPTITVHYTGSPIRAKASTDPAEVYMPWLQQVAAASGKSFEYNYIIPPRLDGSAQVWEYAGDYRAAHSAGENSIAIGVQFAIGVDNHPSYANYDPTRLTVWEPVADAMVDAYRWLRDEHLIRLGICAPTVEQVQHRNMPGAATACPGDAAIGRWADLLKPWTAPVPPPTPAPPTEAPAMILVTNAESHAFVDGNTYPAGSIVWELVHGELRHVTELEYRALTAAGLKPGHRYNNADLAVLPRYGGEVTITGTFTGRAGAG